MLVLRKYDGLNRHCRRGAALCAAVVAGVLACGGCRKESTTQPPAKSEHKTAASADVARGAALLLDGKFDAADDRFTAAIIAQQNVAVARLFRAIGRTQAQDWSGAASELRILQSADLPVAILLPLLARCEYRRHHVDEAREVFEDCLQRASESPWSQFYRIRSLADPAAAIEQLDALLDAQPAFVEARSYRGLLCVAAGRFDAGVADLVFCAAAEPETAENWWLLAEALNDRGAWWAALAAYQQVVDFDPYWETAYVRIARIKASRGDVAAARVAIADAVASDPARKTALEATLKSLEENPPPAGVHVDAAVIEAWNRWLDATTRDEALRRSVDQLNVQLVLRALADADKGAGLPEPWSDAQIEAARANIRERADAMGADVKRLLQRVGDGGQ